MILLMLAEVLLWLTLAVLAPLAGYLTLLAVAARWAQRHPTRRAGERATRFAVLVPAHNEAGVIADTLASLNALDYPRARYAIHVVADNCTDRTAVIAQEHGATVHERTDVERRGKGYALQWLLERLGAHGAKPDAVVILDADSIVSPNFLDVMDARLARGERVIQAHCAIRDPDRTVAVALRSIALAAFNYVRPLGRSELGGSAGLKGNGMVFTSDIFQRHHWSGSLVEDVEFHMALVLDGERVTFAPDAIVWAEVPDTLSRSRTQYVRWERDRLSLTLRYAPRLLRASVARRSFVLLDAAIEWLIPPYSLLVGANLLALFAALGLGRSRAAALSVVLVLGQGFYLLTGVSGGQVSRRWLKALLFGPAFVLWKLWLYLRMSLGLEGRAWVRTIRNEE